jgi:hypothetical protein
MAHGFTKEAVRVDVFIPDERKNEDLYDVQIDRSFIKIAKEFNPGKNPMMQLEYAQSLGLGSLDYELIRA